MRRQTGSVGRGRIIDARPDFGAVRNFKDPIAFYSRGHCEFGVGVGTAMGLNILVGMSVAGWRRSGVILVGTSAFLVLQMARVRAGTNEDFGYLTVAREHMAWPAPESVV